MPAEIFGSNYAFLPRNELLSYEEIVRISTIFQALGVEKIRLTGGEPLLRKNIEGLVTMLSRIEGIREIALTTNGVLLPRLAQKLKDAGLTRVTVSLDALDDEILRRINGQRTNLAAVLRGIDVAHDVGFDVKINMVVKAGENENQIVPMARYFKEKGHILRFIEFMDVGNHNGWNMEHVYSSEKISEDIAAAFEIEPMSENHVGEVARRYRYKHTNQEFGIISSVSQPFCSSCNRARLSAKGDLYTCLFAEKGHDLKTPIRSGIDDGALTQIVSDIWKKRSDRYSEERVARLKQGAAAKKKVEMSYIGG